VVRCTGKLEKSLSPAFAGVSPFDERENVICYLKNNY